MEGEASREETAMITVWVYVNTSNGVGHPDHLQVFASMAKTRMPGLRITTLKAVPSDIP
jgi:hypothetical protein